VTAHCYGEAHGFDSKSAENEGGALGGDGKQEDCRNREEESGGHDQQSCVFHDLFLSGIDSLMKARLPDICPQREKGCEAEGNRLKCLDEAFTNSKAFGWCNGGGERRESQSQQKASMALTNSF
jgi:hypothetical protein